MRSRWTVLAVAVLGCLGFALGAALAVTQQKQFPPDDYLRKILVAYGVANDHPELLEGLPCYCPCELYGHGGVIDCYRSQHAAMCSVCMDIAVMAGQMYETQGAGADVATIQAAVKNQYRNAVASSVLRDLPMNHLPNARAYAQVCSDCHQPPQPGMHTATDWGPTLQRMESYARQSGRMPDAATWDAALQYVRSVSTQYTAASVQQVRDNLQATIDRLQVDEGDSAYYPSRRDAVVGTDFFQRMANAYRLAQELPADVLESTPSAGSNCEEIGHSTVLGCLNSWHAITTEAVVEQVEALAAAR